MRKSAQCQGADIEESVFCTLMAVFLLSSFLVMAGRCSRMRSNHSTGNCPISSMTRASPELKVEIQN